MEDIRRFLHTLYGLFEKGTRIRGILGCFLGGLFLNIVIELMDRQSFSAVLYCSNRTRWHFWKTC